MLTCMDGTNRFYLFIWKTERQQDVEHVARCILCYSKPGQASEQDEFTDKCSPDLECPAGVLGPQEVDVDLVFVVDSSYGVDFDIYRGSLSLVDTALDDLEVAEQPGTSHHGARVALVMHTTPNFWPGHALEWTLENVLLAAPLLRRARVLFTMVASETSVGPDELAELASVVSAPSEQHLLRLQGVSEPEVIYARRFTRAFLSLLKSGTNQYPPPELTEECGGLHRGDTLLQLVTPANRKFISLSIHFVADPCSMDPMQGECQDYTLKWYYNKEKWVCQQFWYGSCGGNANRFETKEECEAQCVPAQ
ncbi:Collagen alpha-4 chain [Plecturocebus cupreus]